MAPSRALLLGCLPGATRSQLAHNWRRFPVRFALYRRPRSLLDGNKYLAAVAKSHPKEAHWYLYLLAAEPSMQRSGVGTMLMEHGLAHADQEGVGGYLETQNEDDLAYYRRFGYKLCETLRPVKDGPPLYTMWRRPR